MLSKVDELCTERDRQVREQRVKYPGMDKAIIGPIERRIRRIGTIPMQTIRPGLRRSQMSTHGHA
jgi:hypothetical protein